MLDHAAIMTAEGAALADAADGGEPAAPVPGTDWALADLVDHVGRLSWFFAGRTRHAGGGAFYDLDRPDGVSATDWFRQGLATLADELAACPDDRLVKTWAGPSTPAWLRRRMAHELAVHRWDAEAAVGSARPLDAEVAADGIDELLSEFLPLADLGAVGGTLHLHATDEPGEHPGEWFVDPTGPAVTWSHVHQKGDVAVRGTTADLLLVLWGRRPPAAVEVIGDATVLDRWLAATSF